MKEALSRLLASCEPGIVLPAYNPSTGETEIRRSEVKGHPQLHIKFKDTLGNTRSCLKKGKKQKKRKEKKRRKEKKEKK